LDCFERYCCLLFLSKEAVTILHVSNIRVACWETPVWLVKRKIAANKNGLKPGKRKQNFSVNLMMFQLSFSVGFKLNIAKSENIAQFLYA
jgi:hypothetical protein